VLAAAPTSLCSPPPPFIHDASRRHGQGLGRPQRDMKQPGHDATRPGHERHHEEGRNATRDGEGQRVGRTRCAQAFFLFYFLIYSFPMLVNPHTDPQPRRTPFQPTPFRRTHKTRPGWRVLCVRRVATPSPPAEHVKHAQGGVFYVFGASLFRRTRKTCPDGPVVRVPLAPNTKNVPK